MSIFNVIILPKVFEISKSTVKNFNDDIQAALECFDKFEEEYQNVRGTSKERAQKDKILTTTLQSIHENDDNPISNETAKLGVKTTTDKNETSRESSTKQRPTKKRSKDEVDGMSSPEQEKRQKRNAAVKAQSIISKQVRAMEQRLCDWPAGTEGAPKAITRLEGQIEEQEREILKLLNEDGIAYVSTKKVLNVNLTQKMRRDDPAENKSLSRRKGDDKENAAPEPVLRIKLEKISLPPEPMDTETLPVEIGVKTEPNKDEIAMPPPVAPVSRARKGAQKEKEKAQGQDKEEQNKEVIEEESRGRRRNTRRKQTDTMPPPAAPSTRSTRASSRASRQTKQLDDDTIMPPPEVRPKRTRAKKKVSDPPSAVPEKDLTQPSEEYTAVGSPAEKPRPKRTRRGKNAEKELQKPEEQPKEPEIISPKDERISEPQEQIPSPILHLPKKGKKQKNDIENKSHAEKLDILDKDKIIYPVTLDETKTKSTQSMNVTVTINNDMDKTVVLHNGVFNHTAVTPNSICLNNETVVLETCPRVTMVLDKQHINDATVIIDKDPKQANVTDDNSLLTEDSCEIESHTPPPKTVPTVQQPTSAVKQKVQQFEMLKYGNEIEAGEVRTTRTKTRAMAKMQDADNVTPPDKMIKPVLSQETLNKMNNMIFNGKPLQQISTSASKPQSQLPQPKTTSSSSTSKLSSLSRHKEAAEETLKREREDARKKKEAMLEAKRELQKKKREEKMANAAAAREAAERERRLAMQAAEKDRIEKQMHADQGKLERLKEAERKKVELARKVAETEERRRAEERARQARLADEQRRAAAARRKQLEEADAMKKEAALMAREIEKRQREYMEKQKLKQRIEDKSHTPFKVPGTPRQPPLEAVYMADGFQHLNSDDDDETPPKPVPAWSTSKARRQVLSYQSLITQAHIDKLFSVRVHSPDLRDIFPNIERNQLKRTSSAVWRTPPSLHSVRE